MSEKKQPEPAPAKEDQPLPRSEFFCRMLTGITIHMGQMAFAPDMLMTWKNTAEHMYEAYCQIVRQDYEKPLSVVQTAEMAARIQVMDAEKADLEKRIGELENERALYEADRAAAVIGG